MKNDHIGSDGIAGVHSTIFCFMVRDAALRPSIPVWHTGIFPKSEGIVENEGI